MSLTFFIFQVVSALLSVAAVMIGSIPVFPLEAPDITLYSFVTFFVSWIPSVKASAVLTFPFVWF